MTINRLSTLSGAEKATGIVVVIDVLRAFSCAALMFNYGIEHLVLVATPEQALRYRREHSEYIVAGEVDGVRAEGFDLGNSPKEIMVKGPHYFKNKKVVLRSGSGTRGAVVAGRTAEEIILGSYMTASAISRYIGRRNDKESAVTLLAMGARAKRKSVEDERCADYIEHLLINKAYDSIGAVWECLLDPSIARSIRGRRPEMPQEDVFLALQRNIFDFVMVGKAVGESVLVHAIPL